MNFPHTAMYQVSIREAKARFGELVDQAAAGRPVVITRHGKPIAILSSYNPDKFSMTNPREAGNKP